MKPKMTVSATDKYMYHQCIHITNAWPSLVEWSDSTFTRTNLFFVPIYKTVQLNFTR